MLTFTEWLLLPVSSRLDSIEIKLVSIESNLLLLIEKVNKMAQTLDEVLADVTKESTDLDSISTLIKGLQAQLADALSGVTLPAPVQAKVDAIFAIAETNKAKIASALNTNVTP